MTLSKTRLTAVLSIGLYGAFAGGCGALQKMSDGVTSINNTVDGVGAMPGKINDSIAKITQATPVRVSVTAADSTTSETGSSTEASGSGQADNANGPAGAR